MRLLDQHVSTIKRVEFTTIKYISVAFGHATLSIYSGKLLIEWPNNNFTIVETINVVCDLYSHSLQERVGN